MTAVLSAVIAAVVGALAMRWWITTLSGYRTPIRQTPRGELLSPVEAERLAAPEVIPPDMRATLNAAPAPPPSHATSSRLPSDLRVTLEAAPCRSWTLPTTSSTSFTPVSSAGKPTEAPVGPFRRPDRPWSPSEAPRGPGPRRAGEHTPPRGVRLPPRVHADAGREQHVGRPLRQEDRHVGAARRVQNAAHAGPIGCGIQAPARDPSTHGAMYVERKQNAQRELTSRGPMIALIDARR